jgi:hypothetical protein
LTPFSTPLAESNGILSGPSRTPRQMLGAQEYDGHGSIHDDAVAQRFGFKGGTIEGPTHLSQFAPLGYAVWGPEFFSSGRLSVHFQNPAFEGDWVRVSMRRPAGGATEAEIWATRSDGLELLRGTASIGASAPSALELRLAALPPLSQPVILADVRVGMTSPRVRVCMTPDLRMGDLYPFTLQEKLSQITETSPWYSEASPWGGPILPFEMISVLMQHRFPPGTDFPARRPSVDLFVDQEIQMLSTPVFVGTEYDVGREVIFLSGSRRTESIWVRSTLYEAGTDHEVARMLLNLASLKDSYPRYAEEHAALYVSSA